MTVAAMRSGWGGVVAAVRGGMTGSTLAARLSRALVWQTATTVVARAGTFAIAILQARILGKAGYGELGMVMSTVMLFGLFSNAAGGATCIKVVAEAEQRGSDRAGRVVGLSLALAVLMSLVCMLAAWQWKGSIANGVLLESTLEDLIGLAGIAVGFQALVGTLAGILIGFKEFGWEGVLRLLQVLVWLPLTTWMSPKWGVYGAMLAYTISFAVTLAAFALVTLHVCRRRGFAIEFRGMWAEMPALTNYSLPMMVNGLLLVPTTWICNAILARIQGGYDALGGFTAATQFRTVVVQIPFLVQGVIWPTLIEMRAQGQQERMTRLFHNAYDLLWAVGLLISLPIALLGGSMMGLFGKAFTIDQKILSLTMAMACLQVLANLTGLLLQAADRTWFTLGANVVYSGVCILATWFLVDMHGAQGMALAFVVGTLVQTVLHLVLLREYLPHLHRVTNFALPLAAVALCLATRFLPAAVSQEQMVVRAGALILALSAVCWIGLVGPSRRLARALAR